MPRFIIETIADAHSGKILAEVVLEGGEEVVIRSEPMYDSHEDAETEVMKVLRAAWPDRRPGIVDPSLGV